MIMIIMIMIMIIKMILMVINKPQLVTMALLLQHTLPGRHFLLLVDDDYDGLDGDDKDDHDR